MVGHAYPYLALTVYREEIMADNDTKEEFVFRPVAILLITAIAKGKQVSDDEGAKERDQITAYVRKMGGGCQLYRTPGAIYDYVSIVLGISDVSALYGLLGLIESGGNVTVRLLLGSEFGPDHRPFKG